MQNLPNFIIAVAPKCDAAVLGTYLLQSNDAYIPEIKVPHSFNSDFKGLGTVRTEMAYRSLYHGEKLGPQTGYASPAVTFKVLAAAKTKAHRFPRAAVRLPSPPFPLIHLKQALKKNLRIRANAPMCSFYAEMSRKEESEPLPASLRKEILTNYADEMSAICTYARGGRDETTS